MKIAFVDCETTGLDPNRHRIWSIGLILVEYNERGESDIQKEKEYFLQDVNLSTADPTALRIGHYYERHPDHTVGAPAASAQDAESVAYEVAGLTSNCILAGNVVDFDARMLTAFLKSFKLVPAWHYHLLDVEAFAAGVLGLLPPWDSKTVRGQLAVPGPDVEHTAMGDAHDALMIFTAALERAQMLYRDAAYADEEEEARS